MAAVRETAAANAAELPIDEIDGWFKISPYGVFNGRMPWRREGRPQCVRITILNPEIK